MKLEDMTLENGYVKVFTVPTPYVRDGNVHILCSYKIHNMIMEGKIKPSQLILMNEKIKEAK